MGVIRGKIGIKNKGWEVDRWPHKGGTLDGQGPRNGGIDGRWPTPPHKGGTVA